MNFLKLIVCVLFLPFYSHSQIILNGKAVEATTGKPIPYATVGLVKQNVGANANAYGEFIITCQRPELDSLIISCIGYKPILFPVRDLRTNPIVALSVSEKRLKPVVIKNQWMYSEVGSYKKSQDYCFTSSGFQSHVARKLVVPSANAQIQTIEVRTSKHRPVKSMFRIHVYRVDSLTQGPGEELTDTVIESSAKWGLVSIDMLPYQIWLPENEFFVAVEWLRIPVNEYRSSSKYEGKDTVVQTYNPCICFTKDVTTSLTETWGLSYSGKWYPSTLAMVPKEPGYSLAISATVKY